MAIRYAVGDVWTEVGEDDGLTRLLFTLVTQAPAKARRKLRLPRDATVLDAIAAGAGIDRARLAALSLFSSGIYSESDFLDQFEEAWEREEYGGDAAHVVARNVAAWQAPGGLSAAIDAAIGAVSDPALARLVFVDDLSEAVPDALRAARSRVALAASRGATSVCLELEPD